jgi:hypothetical protein
MRFAIAGVWIGMLLLAGCHGGKSSTPNKPRASASASPAPLDVNTDPCAMRLHEASGALLLYFSTHRDLPPTLEALAKSPGASDVGELVCPVSHLPYIYTPQGLPAPDGESRIILADAQPSHGGMRWAVVVKPPAQGPLIMEVIPIPEAQFPRVPSVAPKSATQP